MRAHASIVTFVAAFFVSFLTTVSSEAQDWPTWRFDAGRSASTPHAVTGDLSPSWVIELPAPSPAWPEDPRLQFDASPEPIVAGGRLFVASPANDSVVAVDAQTGELVWRFFAEAPVRFAPLAIDDRLYVAADDGLLYCLSQADGKLISRHGNELNDPANARTVLGNDRLVSIRPIRGGPVLQQGSVFYSSGIWPFEGTFFHRLDLSSSADDLTTTSLGDLSPQGYLAASGDRLFLPCGRDRAACVDVNGKSIGLSYDSKGFTDYHVSVSGPFVLHGNKAIHQTKKVWPLTMRRPVVDGTIVYGPIGGDVRAVDLGRDRVVESKDRKGKVVRKRVVDDLWRMKNEDIVHAEEIRALKAKGDEKDPDAAYRAWLSQNPMVIALKAGRRLFGYQGKTLFAIDLPEGDGSPKVSWRAQISDQPSSLMAADGALFVSTAGGAVHRFSSAPGEKKRIVLRGVQSADTANENAVATQALRHVTEKEGFCIVLGWQQKLVDALLSKTGFRIVVVEPDGAKRVAARKDLNSRGVYGHRVCALGDTNTLTRLPPYLASLVIGDAGALATYPKNQIAEIVFRTLRPYGGTACLELDKELESNLTAWADFRTDKHAQLEFEDGLTILRRNGKLPGSADWTREYGDEGNTLMSRDALVKAPLGVLWFGGPAGSDRLFYNRHNWPPGMAVVDGRMFIQGPGKLAAVDVYTGRVFWQSDIRYGGGGVEQRRVLSSVSGDRMGNPLFGTPPAGYHFVVEPDALYLAYPDVCLVYDPLTGKKRGELSLPMKGQEWGRVRVWEDLLIVSVIEPRDPKVDKQRIPHTLVALDRKTGEKRWEHKAKNGLPFVALGRGRVYCVDAHLEKLYRDKRRGNGIPKASTDRLLVALNAKTGKKRWELPAEMIPTWLAFSAERDVLIASNSDEILAVHGSNGYEVWRKKNKAKGFGGHPENLVHKVILWRDQVIDQRGPGLSYNLLSGEDRQMSHPLTGDKIPWEFTKIGHHCNYAIASEHLLTFRAQSAGFFDMETGGTSRLLGFRSGCRNSLIPANGVLNAPNFANGCICSYSIFTSLALIHVPKNEQWSYSAHKKPKGRIERLGLNLGAPGDRRVPDGTFWVGYPDVGGPSPSVPVRTTPKKCELFRLHSSAMEGSDQPWIFAYGLRDLKTIEVRVDGLAFDAPAEKKKSGIYTVRLYFTNPAAAGQKSTESIAKPENLEVSLSAQNGSGAQAAKVFRASIKALEPRQGMVQEFVQVDIESVLKISLSGSNGNQLSGIEFIRGDSPSR